MDASETALLNAAKGPLATAWHETGLDRVSIGWTSTLHAARRQYLQLSAEWILAVDAHLKRGGSSGNELRTHTGTIVERHLRLAREGYGEANPVAAAILNFLGIKPPDAHDSLDKLLAVVKWIAIGTGVFLAFRVYKDFRS